MAQVATAFNEVDGYSYSHNMALTLPYTTRLSDLEHEPYLTSYRDDNLPWFHNDSIPRDTGILPGMEIPKMDISNGSRMDSISSVESIPLLESPLRGSLESSLESESYSETTSLDSGIDHLPFSPVAFDVAPYNLAQAVVTDHLSFGSDSPFQFPAVQFAMDCPTNHFSHNYELYSNDFSSESATTPTNDSFAPSTTTNAATSSPPSSSSASSPSIPASKPIPAPASNQSKVVRRARAKSRSKHFCDQCDRSYAHAKHLRRHMMKHTGEKPYACDYCPSRYTRPDIRKRHVLKCRARMEAAAAAGATTLS